VTGSFIVRKLIRFRLTTVLALAGTALMFAAAFTVPNVLQASVGVAAEQAVSADTGGRDYAIQVLDRQRALSVVAQRTDLLPLIDGTGRIATANAESPANLRTVGNAGANLGLLAEGQYPTTPGEVTISSAVADALSLNVGDDASVVDSTGERQPIRVAGITSSPANATDVTVVRLIDRLDPSEATLFLTETNVFDDQELGPLLNERLLKGRTVEVLAEDQASATRTALLALLSYAGTAVSVTAICLLLALLALLVPKARRDVQALQASGMAPVRSWRIVGSAAVVAVVVGTVLGIGLTVAAIALGRAYISGLLGQDWQTVQASWGALFGYAVGVPFAIFLVVFAFPSVASGERRRHLPRIGLSTRVAVGLLIFCTLVLSLTLLRVAPVQAGAWSGALAAFAIPVLLARLSGIGTARSEGKVVRVVTDALMPVMMVTALLTWITTSYTAGAAHNAISMRDSSAVAQPSGSMLVFEVPSVSGQALRDQYRQLGGKRVATYALPDETRSQLRAASVSIVDCMKRAGLTNPDMVDSSCVPDDSSSPVNIVALSPAGSETAADPSLVEQGRLGLLTFTPQSEGQAVRIDETPAVENSLLGGNMPGAVIAADSPLAKTFDLRPSDGELIAFLDFAELPAQAQAQFRSDITRLAGAAQVAEERNQYSGVAIYFALSRAWAAAGSFLLLVLLGFGGATVISAHARLRRTLIDVGSQPRRHRLLVTRIFATMLATIVVAIGLGFGSAWLEGVHDGSGFGWLWLIPGVAALAATAVLGRAFYRVPSRTAG
jgi:hypothetical protein